jgi:hypothetical protein
MKTRANAPGTSRFALEKSGQIRQRNWDRSVSLGASGIANYSSRCAAQRGSSIFHGRPPEGITGLHNESIECILLSIAKEHCFKKENGISNG